MSRFAELLGLLREPGDDPPPETVYDDLSAEYEALSGSSVAKVAELTELVQAKDSEISRLKAMNYDLLVSAPATEEQEPEPDDEPDDDDDAGIDSLFESDDD